MPMPMEYQRATDHFRIFLRDAQDAAYLESPHQTFTMVQGVLQTFRRRLELKDAIRFAGALPAVLRALFVADWDVEEPKKEFEDLSIMTKEVQSLREPHNFSPDNAINAVAYALRKNLVDETEFNRVLESLPDGSIQYWEGKLTI